MTDAPGYRHVVVDDLPDAPNPTRHKKEVDEAVGASEFGFNVITAAPGERLPWGYHRHPDHEELFYVLAGTVAFETSEGTFEVGAGEAFFVPRDAPNRGVAVGEAAARVVAVGAPKASDDAAIEEECAVCGAVTGREFAVVDHEGERAYQLSCADCGAELDLLTAGPSGS
ncbi:cupin domain-containing protein [Halomarina litorea]|uniref:cupin domain-containing protein n=1 Tax=Halomarina litorea TaxID=2961595 RepID=UPI0020C4513F|nr:cupin domain-containing protein [Halomarina sp. BCD28]